MVENKTIVLKADAPTMTEPIQVGHSGEFNAECQPFDISALIEKYGSGVVMLKVQRKNDAQPYLVFPTQEGNIVTWVFSATDTSVEGSGWCQLLYYVGDNVLKKSDTFRIYVSRSLGEESETPDPWEGFSDQMAAYAAESKEAAANAKESEENAEESAQKAQDSLDKLPYPNNETGTWWIWNNVLNRYVDTGEPYVSRLSTYEHEQTVLSETWTINHNLGRYPSVFIVDSAGSVVVGDVKYVDLNTVIASFTSPFLGKAYLN